jgi:hypothetical protein
MDHGRLNFFGPEKFLDRSDVIPVFKQVGGERCLFRTENRQKDPGSLSRWSGPEEGRPIFPDLPPPIFQ